MACGAWWCLPFHVLHVFTVDDRGPHDLLFNVASLCHGAIPAAWGREGTMHINGRVRVVTIWHLFDDWSLLRWNYVIDICILEFGCGLCVVLVGWDDLGSGCGCGWTDIFDLSVAPP